MRKNQILKIIQAIKNFRINKSLSVQAIKALCEKGRD